MHTRNGSVFAILIALFAAVLLSSGCAHQVARWRAAGAEDLPAEVHAYLSLLAERGFFRGYALVASGDEILFSEGYGPEDGGPQHAFTADSPFRIASVTKQFTAAAILICHEQDLLSLDAPVATYLPVSGFSKEVTVRHLLTHTSGLGTDSLPGETFVYSNEGYDALGSVIEAVSGVSYGRFIEDRVCSRVGLENTYVDRDGGRGTVETGVASGGLVSTASDLYRWSRFLAADSSDDLLSYSSMTHHSVSAHPGVRYGYGIAVRQWDESSLSIQLLWHAGTLPGSGASVCYLPAFDTTVVILTDSDRTDLFTVENDVYRLVIEADVSPRS